MTSSVYTGDVRQMLDHFRQSVDQLFENVYGFPVETGRPAQAGAGGQWIFSPVVESVWSDTLLNLRAILPGVAQHDLKVSVQNNQLVIEGERKQPEHLQKNGYRQLVYGKFYSTMTLPAGLDLDRLTGRLHDGVLDIQIPVSEQMKPRQIQIQTSEPRKSISA
ncbi:MAG TPA: Hsp20 family protein [Bryobacteraceae bacterium]|nr:Hsp20 family protein [Bryobacteraceae bacterium]